MFSKLLAFTNIKVLAFSVVAPVIALSGMSGYIIANQKRLAVEQTVEQSVNATLYAAERELSKHLAAAEILASMVDLKRLDTFTVRIDEVMNVAGTTGSMSSSLAKPGMSTTTCDTSRENPCRFPCARTLMPWSWTTGHYDISPVQVSERYKEPFIAIRLPIFEPGSEAVKYVLCVVVRAWTLTNAARAADPPPHWRIGILDPTRAIVGRSSAIGPLDPLIGKVSTQVSTSRPMPPD